MNKSELILERRHAKYMVDFYKIHRHGSCKASATYNNWLKTYEDLKKQIKEYPKKTRKPKPTLFGKILKGDKKIHHPFSDWR